MRQLSANCCYKFVDIRIHYCWFSCMWELLIEDWVFADRFKFFCITHANVLLTLEYWGTVLCKTILAKVLGFKLFSLAILISSFWKSVLHYYWQHPEFKQTNHIATLSKTLMPRTHVLHLRSTKTHIATQFESLTQRICVLHKSKIRKVTVTASNQVTPRINVWHWWSN